MPFCLSANDNLPTEKVEVIVVTGDRIAVSELRSPYSVNVIHEIDIVKKGFRTTVDAIGSTPGVLLQKTAHGQGSPFIRGFTGFRNLFLVDGIRLNNSVFRDGPNQYWNTIDPFSISHFEVVKGPTSVAYGSDAIGGTVNATTRFQTVDDFNQHIPSKLFYRYSTAEQSNLFRGSHELKFSDNSAMSLGATVKDFGNLIAGGETNELPKTGYDEYNLDIKWLLNVFKNTQLTAAYFKTDQNDVPRTHKTIYGKSYRGTSVGSELKRNLNQERELAYLKLSTSNVYSFADSTDITLSFQKQYESRDRLRTQNRADFQGINVDTLGLTINLTKDLESNIFAYGAEYYEDNVNSFSSKNSIQGPVADDAGYKWIGLYAQNKYLLNEETDIDLGLRWNYMKATANSVNDPIRDEKVTLDKHWDTLIGNLRINYQLIPSEQSLYAGISQGFRAPNLSDLTRFDSARSNEFEIPSLELAPEKYLSFDAGFKLRSENIKYDLSLYYIDIRDQIQRVPTGNKNDDGEYEITKMNVGKGYSYGGEMYIEYAISKNLNLSASFAYIKGKVDTFPDSQRLIVREYLSRIMPTNAKIALHYAPQSAIWWLNTELITFDKADRLSTRDLSDSQRIPPNGTPGFTVWNMSSGFDLSEAFDFTINLNNIFDKDYRVHGSGQNEAGINLIGSINYRF